MDFTGKVVLITGASSGIGAVTAQRFSKLNASLVLVGRNIERLKITVNNCLNPDLHIKLCADINKKEDVKNIIKETIEKFHRLDVLVNNVGIMETSTIESTSLEQHNRLMNVYVCSAYYLTLLAVEELKKTKGNIIHVSGIFSMRAFPGFLAYNKLKAAIDQFTRCIALEWAGVGLRCNSINPGVVAELHKHSGADKKTYALFLENCKKTRALRRPNEAYEMADVICFLASDKATSITGVNLADFGRQIICSR